MEPAVHLQLDQPAERPIPRREDGIAVVLDPSVGEEVRGAARPDHQLGRYSASGQQPHQDERAARQRVSPGTSARVRVTARPRRRASSSALGGRRRGGRGLPRRRLATTAAIGARRSARRACTYAARISRRAVGAQLRSGVSARAHAVTAAQPSCVRGSGRGSCHRSRSALARAGPGRARTCPARSALCACS